MLRGCPIAQSGGDLCGRRELANGQYHPGALRRSARGVPDLECRREPMYHASQMAGGPGAKTAPCVRCTEAADRIREGLETDWYLCPQCGQRFGICFERGMGGGGPPTRPLVSPRQDPTQEPVRLPRTSGYYPIFQLPPRAAANPRLARLLSELWSRRYRELYEQEEPLESLDGALHAVLAELCQSGDKRGHARLLAMARALALGAQPTVAAFEPENPEPQWALDAASAFPELGFLRPEVAASVHFPPNELRGVQGLNEALDVFRNLIRALDPDLAREALLEILEDCLTGHAIFPGSAGRRDLFNWWLVEVVPAAWEERTPDRIYTRRWPWPPAGKPE